MPVQISTNLGDVNFSMFLDKPAVQKAIDENTRKAYTRIGGQTRTIARRSIRFRKFPRMSQRDRTAMRSRRPEVRERAQKRWEAKLRKIRSEPKNPPRAHTKHKYRSIKNILFFYHPQTKSLIVGPVQFRTRARNVVPETLEKGGNVYVRRRGATKGYRVEKRPFMDPAFAKVKDNLGEILKDYIKP